MAGKSTIIIKNFKDNKIGNILTGILNSSLISFYLKESFSALGIDGGINFSKDMVEEIPIPERFNLSSLYNLSFIISLLCSINEDTNPCYTFFTKLLDAQIYELYLPNEITGVRANVLYYLDSLPDIQPLIEKGETEKALKTIGKVYRELSASDHPVSIAMARMQEIEEVQIIEGKK